eukprot:scaffold652331_cov30-Prasinocladus_malaysianus.AAC.1
MTATSELINIQAFGIVAGMNIFFLYVLNLLLMPPSIIIWARNFAYLPFCVCSSACLCCGSREAVLARHQAKREAMGARAASLAEEDANSAHQAPKDQKFDPEGGTSDERSNIRAKRSPEAEALSGVSARSLAVRASADGLERVEKFFNGQYMHFLTKAKFLVVLAFLALAAVGAYYATLLAPPTDSEGFLPDRHMIARFTSLLSSSNNYWAASDQDTTEEVMLVWGISGMDVSDKDKWDPDDFGSIVWDADWQPFAKSAQLQLLSACEKARSHTCAPDAIGCEPSPIPGDGNRWLVRRTPESPDGEGDCWPIDMHEWLMNDKGISEGLPLEPDEFEAKLKEFYDATSPKYTSQIGYVENDEDGGLELRYLAIRFPSTFSAPQSDAITKAVMAEWKELEDDVNADASDGFECFYTGSFAFVWVFTQESLVSNAVMGLAFVFAIAFVVINLATLNFVISVLCTGTIAGIVVTVLGVGAEGISGWDFGMAESIATVILIGFSMDYCLHIAGAYIESEESCRVERTRDALTHLGVSVVAGAVTTILSGLFLWGTVMLFFQKFAFLITFTVAVSFLWSMVFLPSLLLIVGPQDDFGSWPALFRRLFGCVGNRVQPERLDSAP